MPSLYHTFNLGLNHSSTLSGRVLFVVSSFNFNTFPVAGDKAAGSSGLDL
jgi:hypothetical protein